MKKIVLLLLIVVTSAGILTGCQKKEEIKETQKTEEVQEKEKNESSKEIEKEEQVVTMEEVQKNNMIKDDIKLTNEEEVVLYFEEIEEEVNQETNEPLTKTASQKLKNTFITITDFLFYDGTIGGVTFQELSEETKLKVLSITSRIDSKIETKLPGYKETIQTTAGKVYHNVSNMIKNGISSLQEKVRSHVDDDTYQAYQEGKEELKEGFSNAGEKIVEAGKAVKDKVKNWYENFRK